MSRFLNLNKLIYFHFVLVSLTFTAYCGLCRKRFMDTSLIPVSDESDSEDACNDHDYNCSSKKFINKGRWTKDEVASQLLSLTLKSNYVFRVNYLKKKLF